MDTSSPISARIDAGVLNGLDQLAERYDRSRSWLVAQAVREYVERETEFLAFIKVGEDDIAAGRVHTQEEMEAWIEERIARRSAPSS
jgi:predicted transcriptional regulator|nr:ribbon-helix-helix protein, CopG family [Sphingopyxis sp. H050]